MFQLANGRGTALRWRSTCLCYTRGVKKGLDLDRVVLLGRTLEEYVRSFGLPLEQLRGKRVLDVAAGVSSFCAEANGQGLDVTAFDPIYDLAPEDIAPRCEADLDFVFRAIGGLEVYRWSFYKSPEGMRLFRERAWKTFLSDYQRHRSSRYVAGLLPGIPFSNGRFHTSLVSYFLFVYQDQLTYEFHRDSILDLMRVTSTELRIYPTVTFEGERSIHLDRLRNDPSLQPFRFDEVATDFEFLANSNSFLRVRHG